MNVSIRCGCSAKARQIRLTALCESPVAAAIERVDQWVASAGCCSSVLRSTSSTCSSEMRRGAPGRGSSSSPSSPSATNRRRHLPTVAACTPSSEATAPLLSPAAQRNTIRARDANA